MSEAKMKTMPALREKTRLMSASEIERTLIRLAHQIVEKNNGGQKLGLVGIKRRGGPARRAPGPADQRNREGSHRYRGPGYQLLS